MFELLRFTVLDGCNHAFVQRNRAVWLAPLMNQPGFLGATVLESRADSTELLVVIRWRSDEDLRAFPSRELAALEAQMDDIVIRRASGIYLLRDSFERDSGSDGAAERHSSHRG